MRKTLRLAGVSALSVTGLACAGASFWLPDLDVDSWLDLIGIRRNKLTINEANEWDELQPSASVEMPPVKAAHPFQNEHWVWRCCVAVRRVTYLLSLVLPVACYGFYYSFFQRDDKTVRGHLIWMLRDAVERAGCTCMKFGQWISMRPDLFPRDLVEEMASLRDHAPVHSFNDTRAEIRESFGEEIETIFEYISPVPVASGCVGQVYRARLREEYALADGERDVAVKVRHPSVLLETFVDVEVLFGFFVPILNMVVDQKVALPFVRDDFHDLIFRQIDFKWEAYHLSKFSRNFHNEISGKDAHVCFPRVSPRLLSETVLVETWAEGTNVSDIFNEPGSSTADVREKIAEHIFDVCMKMHLRDNFIHSDLHAGNLLYDAAKDRLTILDAGMASQIAPQSVGDFGGFLRAVALGDAETVANTIYEFHDEVGSGIGKPDRSRLQSKISQIFVKWKARGYPPKFGEASQCTLGDVMGEVFSNILDLHVVLRSDVSVALASMQISEGLVMGLSPHFDMVSKTLPYFVRYGDWGSPAGYLAVGSSDSGPLEACASTRMGKG